MIKNQKSYNEAMRTMIQRVQNLPDGATLCPFELSTEDAEILSDCIKNEYVIGRATYHDKDTGTAADLRTMDGKMHPELINNFITPKGLAFLNPDNTRVKANVALIISIAALIISFLSQIDKILQNMGLLKNLIG